MIRRLLLLVLALGLAAALASAASADPRPRITVPPDMTVEAQNFAGAAVTYTASATNPQGDPIPVSCAPPSGSTFPLGETTVSCTARIGDEEDTRRFRITVLDRTPPTVQVPPDRSVRTTNKSGVVVTFSATATDLVDGPVTPACTPLPGARFPLGVTGVTCTAADRHGNAARASFTVTVSLVRVIRRTALLSPLAGAQLTAPPLLAWREVPWARFYNVQVKRNGRKILSLWPTRPRLRMRWQWTFQGRVFRLRPGTYAWAVFPAFGTAANPRYGRIRGPSTFRIVAPG
jgi:hypothetical protein